MATKNKLATRVTFNDEDKKGINVFFTNRRVMSHLFV